MGHKKKGIVDKWYIKNIGRTCHVLLCEKCGFIGRPKVYGYGDDQETDCKVWGCPVCGIHKGRIHICMKDFRHTESKKGRITLTGEARFHMDCNGYKYDAKSNVQVSNIIRMRNDRHGQFQSGKT